MVYVRQLDHLDPSAMPKSVVDAQAMEPPMICLACENISPRMLTTRCMDRTHGRRAK